MPMTCQALGVGLWSRGMTSYDELRDVLDGVLRIESAEFVAPAPNAIPARERRRAGLMINLAVEVAHQACEQAGVDKSSIPSVFVSAMGDTEVTDYMCRKLAQPDKLLSPTKFHNSVHNAPSGYWTISAGNRAPSTFVGGFTESFGVGLLETVAQVQAGRCPVLLVAYDIANREPFGDVLSIRETLGFALVLAPANATRSGAETSSALQAAVTAVLRTNEGQPATPAQHPQLRELASGNPMGAALTLAESLVIAGENADATTLQVPASPGALLELTVSVPGRA